MPSSVFATVSRFTFSVLAFLSMKICKKVDARLTVDVALRVSKLFVGAPFFP